MGPSGSGKSTLLHCAAGLDTPTMGKIFFGESDVSKLSDRQMTKLRRDRIGFIFQSYNLVPTLNVRENIEDVGK
jgi:putative ABC transport system ATP-binding protein